MNVLAEGVVQFTAEGVEKIESAVNRVFSILGRFTKQGSVAVEKFLNGVKKATNGVKDFAASSVKSMSQAASSFTLFGVAVSGAIGAFVAKASSGTVEGERFGLAMRRLTLVMGDQLAPYIRKATAAVNEIASAIARVDAPTRNWITGLVLATGAALTAGITFLKLASMASPALTVFRILPAILGILAPVISAIVGAVVSLGGVLVAVMGPFLGVGAIVAAVVVGVLALGGAFSMANGQALSLGSVLGGVFEVLADIWSVLSTVAEVIIGEVIGGLEALGRAFMSAYADYVAPAVNAIGQAVLSLAPIFQPVVDRIAATWKWLTDNISLSWKSVVRFVGDAFLGAVLLIVEGINGIGQTFGVVVAGIIETLAAAGKATWLFSDQTVEAMNKAAAAARGLQLIDENALVTKLGAASNKIGGMLDANTGKAKDLAKSIDAGVNSIKAPTLPEVKMPKVPEFKIPEAVARIAQDQIKKPRDTKGLTPKMDVTFEGLSGTFDRLQKAFATNPGLSVEEAQLKELQRGNDLQGQVVQGINKMMPAVGA